MRRFTGQPDGGTIFRLNTDGSGYAVLKYFGVRAIPSELSYQWFLNDRAIIGATGSSLRLTNLLFGQSGSYTVVITNAFGAVTSGPAMLQVIAPVERRLVPAINLGGETGSVVSVEHVNSITPAPSWLLLDTVSLASTPQLYFDLTTPLPPQRFYRASQPTMPSRLVPTISMLGMVPAITLTGEVSRSLRLDSIYPIGPTDAWFTLDTVTLTNTTQLYFDVSALNQPTRLYRVIPLP